MDFLWFKNCQVVFKNWRYKKKEIIRKKLEEGIDWNEGRILDDSDLQIGIENIQPEMEKLGRDLVYLDGSPVGKMRQDYNEVTISVGLSEHWTYLIREHTEKIEECLDELGIDELF